VGIQLLRQQAQNKGQTPEHALPLCVYISASKEILKPTQNRIENNAYAYMKEHSLPFHNSDV
jgi:hypothetical protein